MAVFTFWLQSRLCGVLDAVTRVENQVIDERWRGILNITRKIVVEMARLPLAEKFVNDAETCWRAQAGRLVRHTRNIIISKK